MIWFMLFIVLTLVGVGWLILAPGDRMVPSGYTTIPDKHYNSVKPFGWIGIVLGVICLVMSMVTTVGTKSVGVPTVFNKITGETLDPGLHFKAPWVKVTDIDGTVQPEEYAGESCISVKIADGGTGCVWVAYRWRINPEQADVVFAEYRNSELEINDAVRSALVSTNMKASINESFSDFDPLGDTQITSDMTVDDLAKLEVNVNPDYAAFNDEIDKAFNEKIVDVGDQVELISVTISYFQMPERTQTRIDAFNAQTNETKIAVASIATKKAQSEANAELEKSVDNPNVLVSKCLDSLAAGDFTAPVGFNCWPGSNSSVVVPATR